MALAVLSPWPPVTSVAARTAALACLKDQLGDGITDDRLHALGEAASALVEQYGPDAPQAVRNEAVIRCSAWLNDAPASGIRDESAGPLSASYTPSMTGALRASGAQSLLAPWRVRRAGAI